MNIDELEEKLNRLELHSAWQDEMLEDLNKIVARLQDTIRLQQQELQLLYHKINQTSDDDENTSHNQRLQEDLPPHY